MNNYFELIPLPSSGIKFNINHQNPAGQNVTIEFLDKAYKLDNELGDSAVVWVMYANFYLNISNPNPNEPKNQPILFGCVASNAIAINRVTSELVGKYYLVNSDLSIDNFSYKDLPNIKLIYSLNESDLYLDQNFANDFWSFVNQQ